MDSPRLAEFDLEGSVLILEYRNLPLAKETWKKWVAYLEASLLVIFQGGFGHR
jgi:hypothetical protein